MNGLLEDFALIWRKAMKNARESWLIVLTLALGIGANSAMFSAAYQVLLAPLPYANADRLVKLEQDFPAEGKLDYPWSLPTFQDFAAQNRTLSELFGYSQQSLTMVGQGDPYYANTGIVSANYFSALGIAPLLGRGFEGSDEVIGQAPVMLLSHDFWQRKFNADPAVLGRSLELNGLLVRVIGVLPEMPAYPNDNDLWIPYAADPYLILLDAESDDRRKLWFSAVFAVLQEDASPAQARAEANTIASRLAEVHPDVYPQDFAISVSSLQEEMLAGSRSTFLLLLALALLILLITCANVSNLNLARLERRQQELALREAVGASPARLSLQLLTEGIVFAVAGGLLGLLLAFPGLHLLARFMEGFTPLAREISLDGSLLLLSLGVALLCGVLSNLAPLLLQRDLSLELKEGSDRATVAPAGTRLRQLLLAMQFSLSFVVLVTSTLILLSLFRLNAMEPGFDPEQVLAISLYRNVDLEGDPQDFPRQIRAFGLQLLSEVEAVPGVSAAGFLNGRPLLRSISYDPPPETFVLEASLAGDEPILGSFYNVSEAYFEALGIPLLQGRLFTADDDADAPEVALVNASFAERYFTGGEAVGKRLKFHWEQEWKTIVGVVGNVRARELGTVEGPAVYSNFRQAPGDVMNLYVKSGADPTGLSRTIGDIIHGIDSRQSISSIQPLQEIRADSLAPAALRALLILCFGLLALLITLSGVAGMVAWSVRKRVREIGVHMALGANPARIAGLFFGQVFRLYLAGLSLGLLLMLALLPVIEPLLFGTPAFRWDVFIGSGFALGLAVLVAAYLPAKQAGALAPVEALYS